jgi:nucleotide-binding universal stress UspA family protein
MTAPEAPTGRILVGVDGSPASLHALSWAARQAELTGGSLEVLMTWQWPGTYGWAAPIPADYDPEADVRRTLEAAVEPLHAAHPGVTIRPEVAEGRPEPILVERSKGADLLVVGSRGHGEFVGMVIGSVGEYCAAHAHCPVLVHRPKT